MALSLPSLPLLRRSRSRSRPPPRGKAVEDHRDRQRQMQSVGVGGTTAASPIPVPSPRPFFSRKFSLSNKAGKGDENETDRRIANSRSLPRTKKGRSEEKNESRFRRGTDPRGHLKSASVADLQRTTTSTGGVNGQRENRIRFSLDFSRMPVATTGIAQLYDFSDPNPELDQSNSGDGSEMVSARPSPSLAADGEIIGGNRRGSLIFDAPARMKKFSSSISGFFSTNSNSLVPDLAPHSNVIDPPFSALDVTTSPNSAVSDQDADEDAVRNLSLRPREDSADSSIVLPPRPEYGGRSSSDNSNGSGSGNNSSVGGSFDGGSRFGVSPPTVSCGSRGSVENRSGSSLNARRRFSMGLDDIEDSASGGIVTPATSVGDLQAAISEFGDRDQVAMAVKPEPRMDGLGISTVQTSQQMENDDLQFFDPLMNAAANAASPSTPSNKIHQRSATAPSASTVFQDLFAAASSSSSSSSPVQGDLFISFSNSNRRHSGSGSESSHGLSIQQRRASTMPPSGLWPTTSRETSNPRSSGSFTSRPYERALPDLPSSLPNSSNSGSGSGSFTIASAENVSTNTTANGSGPVRPPISTSDSSSRLSGLAMNLFKTKNRRMSSSSGGNQPSPSPSENLTANALISASSSSTNVSTTPTPATSRRPSWTSRRSSSRANSITNQPVASSSSTSSVFRDRMANNVLGTLPVLKTDTPTPKPLEPTIHENPNDVNRTSGQAFVPLAPEPRPAPEYTPRSQFSPAVPTQTSSLPSIMSAAVPAAETSSSSRIPASTSSAQSVGTERSEGRQNVRILPRLLSSNGPTSFTRQNSSDSSGSGSGSGSGSAGGPLSSRVEETETETETDTEDAETRQGARRSRARRVRESTVSTMSTMMTEGETTDDEDWRSADEGEGHDRWGTARINVDEIAATQPPPATSSPERQRRPQSAGRRMVADRAVTLPAMNGTASSQTRSADTDDEEGAGGDGRSVPRLASHVPLSPVYEPTATTFSSSSSPSSGLLPPSTASSSLQPAWQGWTSFAPPTPTPGPIGTARPIESSTSMSYFDIRPSSSPVNTRANEEINTPRPITGFSTPSEFPLPGPSPLATTRMPSPKANRVPPSRMIPSPGGRPGMYQRKSQSLLDLTAHVQDEGVDPRSRSPEQAAAVQTPGLEGRSAMSVSPARRTAVLPSPGQSRLARRQSMYEMRREPPVYDNMFFGRAFSPQQVLPREEEGKETLPPYTCAVHIEGYMPRKMEFMRPGVQAKDRAWKRQYVVLHGTSLKIFRQDPASHPVSGHDTRTVGRARSSGEWEASSRDGIELPPPVHYHEGQYGVVPGTSSVYMPTNLSEAKSALHTHNQLVKHYTLQSAESGLAADYLKRKHVVRVRAEGEQFLLQAKDDRGVIDWIEALQAATNISLDLDDRPLPKFITLPRRRRRRRRPEEVAAAAAAAQNAVEAAIAASLQDSANGDASQAAAQSNGNGSADSESRRNSHSGRMIDMLAEEQDAYMQRPGGATVF